jgi:hypothetical protein
MFLHAVFSRAKDDRSFDRLRGSWHGNDGTSQVPVSPPLFVRLVPGPRRDRRFRPYKAGDVAPLFMTEEAPAIMISRLNSKAFKLAVYASP